MKNNIIKFIWNLRTRFSFLLLVIYNSFLTIIYMINWKNPALGILPLLWLFILFLPLLISILLLILETIFKKLRIPAVFSKNLLFNVSYLCLLLLSILPIFLFTASCITGIAMLVINLFSHIYLN